MKDNLEKLVKVKRQEFDDKEPSPQVWDKITHELHGGTKTIWLWKAAAILFFVTTVGLFFQDGFISKNNSTISERGKISHDFEDIETYYIDLISEKTSLIYDLEEQNTEVDMAFEQDLQKMDAMYQVLKEELKANPSKQVVDALILNLLVRIDILNEQLQELDPTAEDDKNSNEINA